MPQLDKVTFFVQSISVFLSFIGVYYLFIYYLLPDVQLSVRQRKILLDSLVKELNLIRFKFNIHMKLGLHNLLLNKKNLLNFFYLIKDYRNKQYFYNLKKVLKASEFSFILGKVLFKFLLLKTISENNTVLVKKKI